MTDKQTPHLTRSRWSALKMMKQQKSLLRRPFLSKELKRIHRCEREIVSAHGALLVSLEKAGWVERITIGNEGMPFRTGGPQNAWQITDAGREAIASCPDTFPGEPVYD